MTSESKTRTSENIINTLTVLAAASYQDLTLEIGKMWQKGTKVAIAIGVPGAVHQLTEWLDKLGVQDGGIDSDQQMACHDLRTS